jgi:Zn-finger nucleic acid-binding protein
MAAAAFGAVGYLECPRCAGLFLRSEAFAAVTADADTRARVRQGDPLVIRKPGDPFPPVRYRPCPVCRKLMNRQNYAGGSGVVIDACRAHGYWFDRGELTAIVDFLENGGWDRVRKRERERLEEEIRSLENARAFHRATDMPASVADRDARGLESLGELVGFLGSLLPWRR